MERGARAGPRRRPAEEERGGPGDAKRACRSIEVCPGEDADQGLNDLPPACSAMAWTSESKGVFAREILPGHSQGRQSSVISANNGRRPTQPCLRCLAGESGHFSHTKNC
ncbi:uncharacterized protein C10orf143 homolog [Macrotis lagotis]|uniref:uncharacterized protein C10orf143 homolog n=1 Tax=Macrotis lagotis TaxID=92651 RepID=UPI003D689D79